ncbi:CoB--CoM heterodisulfide reductase iron-sulfur subunit A family protein [Pengzhenrongella phosphoraccumulans]|uniref:CoB--CoM heterodisulfide reductase iron-sulfur subunit A family protein n=1 Tax=Pengzhenrongella phosphoraccumulans TaxID=3114394 RepID=UPI00388E9447
MSEQRRIGVYICHCGGNISDYVDVAKVRDALKDDPDVVVAETTMFACADGTQHEMIRDIQEKNLDGLVVASCSPKLHQITFRGVAKRADLNPYAYTQVNVREQASWAHTDDKTGATEKAIGLVKAGIAKTRLSTPLEPLVVKTLPRTMVIGGGVAGLRAAIGLADIGLAVVVVERAPQVGGWVAELGPMFPSDRSGRDQIDFLVAEIAQRPSITVLTDAELVSKSGSFGNYVAEVRVHGRDDLVTTEVGTIVVATGFDTYAPEIGEFGYGIDGVLTLPEFTALVDGSTGALTHRGKPVRTIAYIYCVGNRQAGGNEYCSKFCCAATVHASVKISKRDAGIRQYHLHRDIRTYGKYELMYTESRERGSVYLRFPDESPPSVATMPDGRLAVTVTDALTGNAELTIPADLVVLVTGMVPRENADLTSVLKLPVGGDGFFNEIHPKLRPVETVVAGVMIAGACQGPKTASEAVASGLAAVTQSAGILLKGFAELDPLVATVDNAACTGCNVCQPSCPYDAISTIQCDGRDVAHISASVCKGCGGCVPVCPAGAIDLLGYTDAQMLAAIDSLGREPVA